MRLRGLLRPQLLDQPARRDDLVRVEQEQREQAALPLPAQIERPISVQHLERPENPELHLPSTPCLPAVSDL